MNFENLYSELNFIFAAMRSEPDNDQVSSHNQLRERLIALFPEGLRESVIEALFYYEVEIVDEELDAAHFCQHVSDFAEIDRRLAEQEVAAKEMFEGVLQLLASGQIKGAGFISVLQTNSKNGYDSLLMQFIRMQQLASPLDAAVSFIAWHHAKALSDLGEVYGVDVSKIRAIDEPDCFGTSESQMGIFQFSLMGN